MQDSEAYILWLPSPLLYSQIEIYFLKQVLKFGVEISVIITILLKSFSWIIFKIYFFELENLNTKHQEWVHKGRDT